MEVAAGVVEVAVGVQVEVEAVVGAAFNQRRKMLRSSLKSLRPDAEARIRSAGIDPTRRAETLSLQEFGQLIAAFR